MTTRRIMLPVLITLALATAPIRAEQPVTGRVLTADGQPAVGATVGMSWQFDSETPKGHAFKSVTTDADGQFTLEANFHFGRSEAFMAVSLDEQTGGILAVTPAEAQKGPVEIKLAPLVQVRGVVESEHPKYPVQCATAIVMLADNQTRVADAPSFSLKAGDKLPDGPARYQLRLPPGDYVFQYFEPIKPDVHLGQAKWVKLRADVPGTVKDIKAVQLSLIPRLAQREAGPLPLHIKAARGVGKDVQLAAYRGKWVVLQFWSINSAPSLLDGLPAVMDLWDDHADSRDQFAVLTVHGQGADDLDDLDRQLAPLARDAWNGRALPFPILLDDGGQTCAEFEVESLPTTVVIRPDGKVAEEGLDELRAALPAVPVAVQVARALDRPIHGAPVAGAGAGHTLSSLLETLGTGHDFAIKPDPAALQAAGVTAETRIPLTLVGAVTLRTALRLALGPLGLAAVPDAEGLVITNPPTTPASAPTPGWTTFQAGAADRLKRHLAEPITVHHEGKPLANVLDQISREVNEPIVLAPTDRRAGVINPAALVSVDADQIPLSEILRKLLTPLGLEAVIRDEVILVRQQP